MKAIALAYRAASLILQKILRLAFGAYCWSSTFNAVARARTAYVILNKISSLAVCALSHRCALNTITRTT